MAKMDIKERIAKAEKELMRLQVMEEVLTVLKERQKWTAGEYQYNEDGERVVDDEGNYIYVRPEEDSFMRARWDLYQELMDYLEK